MRTEAQASASRLRSQASFSAIFATGLASLIWLEPEARQVLGVELDVNTLAFSGAAIVCGFEAMFFSVFARAVAADMQVLPREPAIERLRRFWTLERGLLGGGAVFTVGLLAALAAVGDWGRQSFGPLDPTLTLRIVLPAATARARTFFAAC